MTPVVVYFSIGEPRSTVYVQREYEPGSFRLVVKPGELNALHVEVEAKDRMGASSWRPAKAVGDLVNEVLALALMKSQMTPLQRIELPQMLHPDGVIYMNGQCEIHLGRVRGK